MKVAICGYPSLALKLQQGLRNSGIEIKVFIKDFIVKSEGATPNLPLIDFFYFRRLVNAGELDGVIIAADAQSNFTKGIVPIFKFYGIAQVGVIDLTLPNPNAPIYWLDSHKIFLPYLEADITDICNLKCSSCYHFANFSFTDDLYPIESFRRDIRQVMQKCDIVKFRLLGGEPLLMKNLDRYIKITRQYLPKANLGIVTNGLLIPSLSPKILDALRENNFMVYISVYPPTKKILDKIKAVLDVNKIPYHLDPVEKFLSRMTLNGNHDPLKTRCICSSDICRTMINGKIYKCPIDAFSFKFKDRFDIKIFSSPTGVDIYAENFSSMLERLDGNVELCYWCAEKHRQNQWESTNNPKLEEWLADPDELKFL